MLNNSKKTKRKSPFEGMARVAAAPVAPTTEPTRRESDYEMFIRQEREAEEAKEKARIAPMLAELNKNYVAVSRLRDEVAKAFWSQSSDVIGSSSPSTAGAVDAGVELPQRESPDRDTVAEARAWRKFCDEELTKMTGYVLSPAGRMRVGQFASVQAQYANADMTSTNAFGIIFRRLLEQLEAFAPDEIGFDEAQKPAEREPEAKPKSLDEVFASESCESRDGRGKLLDAVAFEQNSELKILYSQWLTSLANNFGFFPTEAQQKFAQQIILRRNLSPYDRRSYDLARVAAVQQGVWPQSVLTREDHEAILAETEDSSSFTARQELLRKMENLK